MPSKFTLNRLSRKRCLANNKKNKLKIVGFLLTDLNFTFSKPIKKKYKSCHQIINHIDRLAAGTVLQLKKTTTKLFHT